MASPPTRSQPWRKLVTRFVNPLTRPVAGVFPGFGILTHVGRRTGRVYRTPINVFRRRDRFVFAPTYGSDAEWVKNVLAAGGCDLRTRRHDLRLVDPKVQVDPELRELHWLARTIERANRVTEILTLREADRPAIRSL